MPSLKDLCLGMMCLFLVAAVPLTSYGDQPVADASQLCSPQGRIDLCNFPGRRSIKGQQLEYYLYVADFAKSFIEIPTANVAGDSTTISSKYLAGRAPLYDKHGVKVGTCSASFLCMQNGDGIFTDISNYLSVDNGPIVSWFTPTTLINLELDSIVHGMVTECIVVASTKIGVNPFYGKKFNMIVSSSNGKIYFELTQINP